MAEDPLSPPSEPFIKLQDALFRMGFYTYRGGYRFIDGKGVAWAGDFRWFMWSYQQPTVSKEP